MFETAELGRKVSKQDYDKAVPGLRTDLLSVQNELQQRADFSVVIVIGGVEGAGRGQTVNTLFEWMDPRFLEAHAFGPHLKQDTEEIERPDMWRFWRVLPPKGRIGLYIGSWYTNPIISRVYGETGDAELVRAIGHINAFEKALSDDGTLILKYWFHLSKKAQKKRLKSLSRDPDLSWLVTERDWRHLELYDTFVQHSGRVLNETSTGEAPWNIIEGTNKRYRELTVARHILDNIQRHARKRRRARPKARPAKARRRSAAQPTILSTLDMSKSLTPKTYKKKLFSHQVRLARLQRKALQEGVSTVMLFEGWDAAGKGGAIRRVNRALDARSYRVVPIAAPSDEERARHYLWRFWRHMPRAGHVTIFDRTWYGRVLVERVEGFASLDEWKRAYWEIRDFEELLSEHGMALVKFWLHIDRDEQLRRFKAREKTSYKKYKITDEDYRNRAKWAQYEEAINEMVERTHTPYAPWTLVEANDKRYARMKVVATCCEALEQALDRRKKAKKSS